MNRETQVIEANIKLHSRLSDDYNSCEPHFRKENIKKVRSKIESLINFTSEKKLLDLGCGTGFMIDICRDLFDEIHGVDVTQKMLDKVKIDSASKIILHNQDTGKFDLHRSSFDLVTGYSFLHHLFDVKPTIETAFKALKTGGVFYADLDPNFYFWDQIDQLKRDGSYHSIVKREIEMVTYKDEDILNKFGVPCETFNDAEYGKNRLGGFKEEVITEILEKVGFSDINFFYHWFVGQGHLINNEDFDGDIRFKHASVMEEYLLNALPLSKSLFKYVGFTARK